MKTASINLDPAFPPHFPDTFEYKMFKFNAGESHIKFTNLNLEQYDAVRLTHRINSSENLMELLLATDAVRQEAKRCHKEVSIDVIIPYIPYARQDRVMVAGEPFSLRVFANIINAQNYHRVMCADPHSEAASLLINNLEVLTPYWQLDAIRQLRYDFASKDFVLVSPDAGAMKKIYNTAKWVKYNGPILCATKLRDVSTGNIIRTTVDMQDVNLSESTAVIIDDICSGGRTFMELAKVLKANGAKHVVLVVTHYENVANIFHMKESGVDAIYTTNSIKDLDGDIIKKFVKTYQL